MPHYFLDAANNATELPFADLDSVQSILNTMPTLAPYEPSCSDPRIGLRNFGRVGRGLQDSAPPSETGVAECRGAGILNVGRGIFLLHATPVVLE